jgi:adenylate cyclase
MIMNNTSVTNNESAQATNSPETLERLLTEMIRYPDRRAELSKEIEETFGQQKAVLVLDMSGFSRTTQRLGIVSFLMMIHQMRLICRPCVEERNGKVIKAEADNLLCLFETVEDAVHATREMTHRLDAANQVLPAENHLYAAFGIGYGNVLNIGDEDIFGDEMNLASKLGEDIARPGEILLTMAAQANLKETDIKTREEGVSISGISLYYYLVEA